MEEHKLLTVSGNSEHMHVPPIPHSHPLDFRDGLQLCEQEGCPTTEAADQETLTDSHALPNTLQCQGALFTRDAKLDLSLGDGDYHAYKNYFLATASSEHSASSVTELEDQSSNNGGVAVTNLPLNAPGCASRQPAREEKESEIKPCSSPPNDMFTSSFAISRSTPPLHDYKVFFCKFCDRQFHSSQALGGHQNAHKRERLVARSTPTLELPPFCCSALSTIVSPMSNRPQPALHMLPSCINGNRSKSFSLVAVGHHAEKTQSAMLVPSMCDDRFEDPHNVSTMYKTKFGRNCMHGNNVYIVGNRSLGIKAHSLVHKPAVAQALHITPQIGVMKGPVGWPRVHFVPHQNYVQSDGSMQATRFATPYLSAASRFVCHMEAPCTLLRLRRCRMPAPSIQDSGSHIALSDICPLPCSEPDNSSDHIDLALHL